MNDRMTPLPFDALMRWALAAQNQVFGVRGSYKADPGKALPLFSGRMEIPAGPAAGPHTQLAQNIIAAYVAGARFFELKTVQTIDGEDLPVSKPCILAGDEGYNVEWSTELTVPEAFDEYVRAWYALKLLSRVLGLGSGDGFIFNMSVGYDLKGIQSEKIDRFIEGMKDAGNTPVFIAARSWAEANLAMLPGVDIAYLDAISPHVCTSITLSTLHGCPPDEIERIAAYLIEQKKLHTFVKLNPTLLGYDFARSRLDAMGFDYIVFDDHHFRSDLQYGDAVPMLKRLMSLADAGGLSFGVKLTNTFPVKIAAGELPGEEMYMSGRSLFALSTALAARLSESFGGKLRISYSGGADAENVASLLRAGIYPITVATTLLKPGGYQRMKQIAEALVGITPPATVDVDAIQRIAADAATNTRYTKPLKAPPSRKRSEKVPLLDCFDAPCSGGCPIHQDIPEYIRLCGEGRYLEALRVIIEDNPLPFITGTICSHRCQGRCRRNFYDETVHIRDVKLQAAQQGIEALMQEIKAPARHGVKVAVIGGGAAGLACAFFLARAGVQATIFEKRESLGGVVRHAIPSFRISEDAITRDIDLIKAMGVEVILGREVKSLAPLREEGYTYCVVATGAGLRGRLTLGESEALGAIDFLEAFRRDPGSVKLGKNVVVIGGGNTAMDTARAAMRTGGVEKVSVVYRRDVRSMPADEEELALAQAEGICFETLLSPESHENGRLTCAMMALGDPDASGRRAPVPTGAKVGMPADTVIAAIGEKVDEAFYQALGVDEKTFIIGDGKRGPATVVEAIADAREAADAILSSEGLLKTPAVRNDAASDKAARKKGYLMPFGGVQNESYRCLECDAICECCVDVCPNRANITIFAGGKPQIVHIDRLCNACGNCETFCPYSSAPYKEKFTLYATEADFAQGEAPGVWVNAETGMPAIRAQEDMSAVVKALLSDYGYLL